MTQKRWGGYTFSKNEFLMCICQTAQKAADSSSYTISNLFSEYIISEQIAIIAMSFSWLNILCI